MYQKLIILSFLFLTACSTYQEKNITYQKVLFSNNCNDTFLKEQMQKLNQNKDVIFVGLNSGYIARDCMKFKLSNEFFDKVEHSYKYDVDLQSFSAKSTQFIGKTLINDTISDYEGSWYERTMVNVYKGLNFMSLKDFENARVEFNRALMRQEKAKEYFENEIKQQIEQAKKNEHYKQNIKENIQVIEKQYNHLFDDFNAQKNYTNPYVTYISSVFFFMDKDYKKAYDLLKEVYIIFNKNEEIDKEFKIFEKYSNSLTPSKLKKYIFIIYENGLSPSLDSFDLTLPFIFENKVVNTSISFPTLKKRNASFEYLKAKNLNDDFKKTQNLFNFDQVVASEFQATLTPKIIKALLSGAIKTGINLTIAKNDSSGVLNLASNIFTILTTKSDLRFWNFLPKNAQIIMLENDGFIEIYNDNNMEIFRQDLDKNKNILILIRSFSKEFPTRIYKMEH